MTLLHMHLQLKADSDNDTTTELTPFVCEYFFNKYGVKRLVQLRLKEILASCTRHQRDKRVRFFSRACGLIDPLPPEYLSFYLSIIQSVMIDQLQVLRFVLTHIPPPHQLRHCAPQCPHSPHRPHRPAKSSGPSPPMAAPGCQCVLPASVLDGEHSAQHALTSFLFTAQ